MRVLVVPDKFKGTLTAAAAARAIAEGWGGRRPQDRLKLVPMSDGGDGFGEILSNLLNARPRSVRTLDAARRPLRARWWWDDRTRTAILESAQVIGLALLPADTFHPFGLDTFGLGRVLLAALEAGARRILVGIGGSATNDAGFGLARSLGWTFLDGEGGEITQWVGLKRLSRIRRPDLPAIPKVLVAVDVQNRLLGRRGCSRVFGPQKGMRPVDFPLAEACLSRLVRIARTDLGSDCSRVPGSGAAGGLGFGLMTFVGAKVVPGFELFARQARLASWIRKSDLVITGEGALDRSTLMGKGVGELARVCREHRVPCVGLAGVIRDRALMRRHFRWAGGLTELTRPAEAQAEAAFWLRRLAERAAVDWRQQVV